MKIRPRVSALTFGIAAAACAVLAQIKFSFVPPAAYGLCMICHARDFLNTVLNNLDPSWWSPATVSSVALKGPIVTTVAVLVGAFIAAVLSGEFKPRRGENFFKGVACGFLVMLAGLIISGCPMRLLLRTAYGDWAAAVSILTLVLGIFLATLCLKSQARRRAARTKGRAANKTAKESAAL